MHVEASGSEQEELLQAIKQQYGSVYLFCKETGLPRGTVYQVLSGRYAGDMQVQIERIQSVLVKDSMQSIEERVMHILRKHRCKQCLFHGSAMCASCLDTFILQTKEITTLLSDKSKGDCHDNSC